MTLVPESWPGHATSSNQPNHPQPPRLPIKQHLDPMPPNMVLARGLSAVDTVLLNAQSQLLQTPRDLAQARYNVLIGGLKLRQANGTLTPEDLLLIHSLLTQ